MQHEHRDHRTESRANRPYATSYRDHLSQGSEVRISEESSPSDVYGVGAELPDYVLCPVRAGTELAPGHRRHVRCRISDRDLRHVWRDGRVTIRHCSWIG